MDQHCISSHLSLPSFPARCRPQELLLAYALKKKKKKRSPVGGTPPPSSPSVFRYLFVYSSFALGVNNINVMVCCCRAALNLHVLDDKYPKTKMLIAPTNQQHSFSPALADAAIGIFTALLLRREPLIRLVGYPSQSPTGAGDVGVYALDPSSTKL